MEGWIWKRALWGCGLCRHGKIVAPLDPILWSQILRFNRLSPTSAERHLARLGVYFKFILVQAFVMMIQGDGQDLQRLNVEAWPHRHNPGWVDLARHSRQV